MKYNDETSMEPHLEEAIREELDTLNRRARTWQTRQICLATLKGIATALHALTGETWSVVRNPEGFIFINDEEPSVSPRPGFEIHLTMAAGNSRNALRGIVEAKNLQIKQRR